MAKLLREPLSRQTANALRAEIVSGSLPPGEPLRTPDITRRYGVSATPVREALASLAAEGFVELHTDHSARVASVSMVDLANLYEIRLTLEPLAVLRSMQQADSEWLESVQNAMVRLREATEPGGSAIDVQSWSDAHGRFHRILCENSGSPVLSDVVMKMSLHSERFRMLSRLRDVDYVHSLHEHEAISQAVVDGESRPVVAAVRIHLIQTMRLLGISDADLLSLIDRGRLAVDP